jgi:hypothetical protein
MKNILLTLAAMALLQVSTCGNKSYDSWAKSGRDGNLIEQLYIKYKDNHDGIESIDERYREVLSQKTTKVEDWNRYDQFAKSYWADAKLFIKQFDTGFQRDLSDYFASGEKSYHENGKDYLTEIKKMKVTAEEINKNMALLKLLASHKQMELDLIKNKPDIKLIEDYNKSLAATNLDIKKTTKALVTGETIANSLK